MNKQTKIIATIGPATEDETTIEQLILAGMNVARFNTKHSDPAWHNERIKRIVTVAKKLNEPIAILLDLQGPEIRINLPEEKSFSVVTGDAVIFTSDEKHPAKKKVLVPQNVIDSLSPEDSILLEDGACEFIVVEKAGNYLTVRALVDCTIKHRKTMNTPGVVLDMPSLTERDYQYLDQVESKNIDYVGLSFVRNKRDIEVLKNELIKRKIDAAIVAKIENQEALDNIDEIIATSDAIMIARGDLGVEVPFQELTYWQITIIEKCRNAAVPVITATEMLKSMVEKPRPTRAEVSDVAHAIYDGTDSIMLSDETTIGKYPVKAVQTQATIAEYNEPKTSHTLQKSVKEKVSTDSAISHAAVGLINNSNFKVDKIICFTETGRTARLISRFRLKTPVHAITSSEKTMRKLTLYYGITPHPLKYPEKRIEAIENLTDIFKKSSIVQTGDTVLFIHGTFWKHPGLTNTLTIVTID